MKQSNYQAIGFNLADNFFAILDFRISQIVIALIVLNVFPTHWLTKPAGIILGNLILLIISLLILKRSLTTCMFLNGKKGILTFFQLKGFLPYKREILTEHIERILIDKRDNGYRAMILIDDSPIIVPVLNFTSSENLNGLIATYKQLSKIIGVPFGKNTTQKKQSSTRKPARSTPTRNISPSPKLEEVPQASFSYKEKPASSIKGQNKRSSAIAYLRRPDLPPVTRTQKNNVMSFIISAIVAIICASLFMLSS